MTARIGRAGALLTHMGPRWVAFRAAYAARLRLGLLERATPARPWADAPLAELVADPALADPAAYLAHRRAVPPALPFDPGDPPAPPEGFGPWDAAAEPPHAEAAELRRGELRFFGGPAVPVGMPPRWGRNALAGLEAPAGAHWSRIGDFGHGDIKAIWEPSRFAWAFALARAYARDGDDAHAELFWALLEDWRAHSLPHSGPNWKCGQETSLRLIACACAAHAFLHSPATTPARAALLAELAAVSAERVGANLAYALSQRNNHGVSEAAGLFTAGALFPELRGAAGWEARGRALLERLAAELIYPDGCFSQHSANYQRLALHGFVWAIALARRQGRPLSAALHERVGRAALLLHQLQDEATGRLPRYGNDDGALALPLSGCPARDYRPALQAAAYLTRGVRWYPPGPWDEELLWLGGPAALAAPLEPPARGDLRAAAGGLYTLRGAEGFLFTHCGGFRDRPGHADLLHADLWWRGLNVACDAGTYSYNAPEPWDTSLGETARHNTVTVDGLSQMERFGRFLWLPWARGEAAPARRSPRGHLAVWEGRHDGYARLAQPVAHRRALVRIAERAWLVIDRLASRGEHAYTLHWHTPDWPHAWDGAGALGLSTPAGPYQLRCGVVGAAGSASLVRADPEGPRGWRAERYGALAPALDLELSARGASVCFWTVLGPEPAEVALDGGLLVARGTGWQAVVALGEGRGPLVRTAVLGGALEDRL
ncbi:MAG TPA: alginate lyase family protein [Chloroflexaceae bacterium]|nr:alginate lyase family protein [Chloroflexaceae bacterium]